MRVRKDHPLNAVFRGPPNGVEMTGIGRPRIDDPAPDDIGIRPIQSERRRIVRPHAYNRHAPGSTRVFSPELGSHPYPGDTARAIRAVLLALVVMAMVVAVDLAVGSAVVLTQLVVAGPLIAATGATVRQTLGVGALAMLAAIPLGFASDSFLSTEHIVAIGVVAVGAVMAVEIARLRIQRERDAAWLQVQYGVASAIAEAESFEEAAPRLLAAIARPLGREVAQFWAVGDDNALRCVAHWHEDGFDVAAFERVSRDMVFRSGEGLPGQAWQSGRPMWLGDAIATNTFVRTTEAAEDGLHGGMAFPVTGGEECLGVVEVFSREVRERDPELYALTEALGHQIGEFLETLRAEQAVRESEARKGAVLASSLDAVITMDHQGRLVEFNPAAEQLFGYAEDAVVGQEMALLVIPPDLRERHREGLRRYLETGESEILGRRIELRGFRSDGEEFPVELAVNRISDSDPPMFTGTVRDITGRIQAEKDREDARVQLEAILRGVADAVTAQAPDGRLLFANEAAVTMLGFDSADELMNAPLTAIMDRFEMLEEDGRPFPVEALPGRRALAGEDAPEAVVRFRVRATGEERWSAVKATPIRDHGGNVTMAINVIEDITIHKRAELAQRFLARSGEVLASSLDPDRLLAEIANLAVPEIADWCAVDVLGEDGRVERKALAHTDPAIREMAIEVSKRYPPDPDAPAGLHQVIRTGQPELYPEISDDLIRASTRDEEHYQAVVEIGLRSAIIAPMTTRGRTLGALTFVSGLSGRRFDEQDVELAQELARRCATAVENARLYTDRSYIARTLQQSLLPVELPDIPGVEAAARFRPTGEGNEVGGDFYDLFETGPGHWAVVMADVCGKGPDAAAVTALARYTLRAVAMREEVPSQSLEALNEALLRQRDDRRFCTVAYAHLEKLDHGARVAVSSGGHPLPLLLRAAGNVEPVGRPGTLLGVVPDPTLEDHTVTLEPGDALVLYTDGVIENRMGADRVLDERRLAELVATCAGRGADAIAGRIEEAAVLVQSGIPKDDIAVLVLHVVE
jgi:PAS domain S-box-containing protein